MTAALRGHRARPDDHRAGPGPAGLPAPRRSGVGRARSCEPARRQPAGRQSAGHGRAGDRLPGADAGGGGRQRARRLRRRRGADRDRAAEGDAARSSASHLCESAAATRGQADAGSARSPAARSPIWPSKAASPSPPCSAASRPTRAPRIGGFEGRALGPATCCRSRATSLPSARSACCRRSISPRATAIRVVLGPQDDYFTRHGLAHVARVPLHRHARLRPHGHAPRRPALEHAKGYNIVSDGIAPGSIQVPGNGLPIVLLADRQTTGGYPKIATVISADLPALARLSPGAKVRFEAVDMEAADAARRALARRDRRLALADRTTRPSASHRRSTLARSQSRQRRDRCRRIVIV